jgi:hypothetical protein
VIRNSPFTTATAAVNISNFPGSVRTSRRRLRNSELRNHAAARKTRLTPRHKEARVGFALEHLAKDNAFWSQVVFSDEKVFQSSHNGRVRVYRPRNATLNRLNDPVAFLLTYGGGFLLLVLG